MRSQNMTKQNNNRILLIYNILLSVSIIIAGACLISGCLSIYYSGNGYSRELVAQVFSKICIPVYICLGLVVGSFIINAIIPTKHKVKPTKNYNLILSNLISTHDANSSDEYLKLKKRKKNLSIENYCCIFIFSCTFLNFALNGDNFHQTNINKSIINFMWILLPCLAIPILFAVFRYYYSISITKKQIEILKTLPKKEKLTDTSLLKTTDKKILIIKIVIVTVAVGVLIFGAVTGGFADVLTKAVNICTECIGLG